MSPVKLSEFAGMHLVKSFSSEWSIYPGKEPKLSYLDYKKLSWTVIQWTVAIHQGEVSLILFQILQSRELGGNPQKHASPSSELYTIYKI